MLTYLRIAVTVLGATACVLLIALWVRSYSWRDNVFVQGYTPRFAQVLSEEGKCGILLRGSSTRSPHIELDSWQLEGLACHPHFPFNSDSRPLLGFDAYYWGTDRGLIVPHWFVVSLFAIFATLPWVRWAKSFSLRTLLIAMTLVAVVLGIIVMAR